MRVLRFTVITGVCSTLFTALSFGQGGYGSTYQVDVAFPLGVFSQSFKTGYGGHVEFYMESEKYLRLSVFIGYTRWGVDNDGINEQYHAAGGTGSFQLDGHMTAIPLLVGAKLLSAEGGLRVYGLLEVGIYLYSGKVTGQKIENGAPTVNINEESSKSPLGANLGAGLLYPLSTELSLDMGARYHYVKRDAYYSYDYNGNATEVNTDKYLSVSLGITYSFPTGK
jgi:opacity protein-like surface antigen